MHVCKYKLYNNCKLCRFTLHCLEDANPNAFKEIVQQLADVLTKFGGNPEQLEEEIMKFAIARGFNPTWLEKPIKTKQLLPGLSSFPSFSSLLIRFNE